VYLYHGVSCSNIIPIFADGARDRTVVKL